MKLDTFESAARLIRATEDAIVSGPRKEELIDAAEARLGVKFPPSYRCFLQEFGAVIVNGEDLVGLPRDSIDEESFLDVVSCTLYERTVAGLDQRYVVIGQVGDGSAYVIDTSTYSQGQENPVAVTSYDRTCVEVVANNYGEHVEFLLSD